MKTPKRRKRGGAPRGTIRPWMLLLAIGLAVLALRVLRPASAPEDVPAAGAPAQETARREPPVRLHGLSPRDRPTRDRSARPGYD